MYNPQPLYYAFRIVTSISSPLFITQIVPFLPKILFNLEINASQASLVRR
jgi:hypothetical protein